MALKGPLTALGVALVLAGSTGAAVLGQRWLAVERYNAALQAGDLARAGAIELPAAALARGLALGRAGEFQGALGAYHGLIRDGRPGLSEAARFNTGNLYLRQALALDPGTEADLVLPLAELAKEAYRELLRRRPDHWDARYNLERALLLAPDPGPEEDTGFTAPERGPQALVPTPDERRPLP